MKMHRLVGRSHVMLFACLLGAWASNAIAVPITGTAQLGGWVYVDRNNDGQLAFSNEPNPEYVIGDVSISLYSKVSNVETLISTTQTDSFGRYLFEGLTPGTYSLRETQPVEYVDGIDTIGILQSL
ncbi:MAG TPA: SdrD B-like domain-containing protein, partial [Lacipirellulaceae bacterium]|nr:SdrD B-like domain-containing protein [Lacipirellulaceae bacterium]